MHSILGHSDKATGYANRALRQSPFDLMVHEAYVALGNAAIAETRYEEAASFYARAVQSSPKTGTYYLLHAIALALAGHLAEARSLAERGLELEPQFRVRWLCGISTRALADKFAEAGRLLALPDNARRVRHRRRRSFAIEVQNGLYQARQPANRRASTSAFASCCRHRRGIDVSRFGRPFGTSRMNRIPAFPLRFLQGRNPPH